MSDIFISYAREDKPLVKLLAHVLERKGWSVWWDVRIPAGQSYEEVIEKALKTAKSVVVVWTKNSVKSQFVKNEAKRGLRRNVLIPVMLLDEVEIPLEFEHLQVAYLIDWQPEQEHAGFAQFLDDLMGVIGAPVTPVVHPPPVPHLLHEPAASLTSELSTRSKAADDGEQVRVVHGVNKNLSALTVSQGSLSPVFSANILNYTLNVGSNVADVSISATKSDPNAVLSGDVYAGSGIATGQTTIHLSGPGTTTSVAIWVTAPGGTQKTYTVNVSRAALSGNNNLQNLSVSPGTLSPPFSASRTAYTVNVGDSVTSVAVTPMPQDDNSSLTVNGEGSRSGQDCAISLGPAGSSTEVEITVIGQHGSPKTYLISVNRATLPEAAEVGEEPERHEQQLTTAMSGAMSQDSSVGSPLFAGATERSEVDSEFTPVGADRLNELTEMGQPSAPFPYRLIGLGLLVVMGTLVYFMIFLQSPSPGPREVAQYQPPVQPPTTRSEVITPAPQPKPSDKLTVKVTPAKPVMNQEAQAVADTKVQGEEKFVDVMRRAAQPAKKATETEALTLPKQTGESESFHSLEDSKFYLSTTTGEDGATMVLVPAGKFMMGSKEDDKSAQEAEKPSHSVELDAYYLDQYEVTTTRYAIFLQKTNRVASAYWSKQVLERHGEKPIIGVDWYDATAYCSWAGKRLPTEAEWEKAARGTDQRLYPWGNVAPNHQLANYDRGSDFNNYEVLTNVGSYKDGRSPYGAYDMAGNVWEWTADWYDENYYRYEQRSMSNPKGPSSGQHRVVRGGAWGDASGRMRSAIRYRRSATARHDFLGFRCVRDITK